MFYLLQENPWKIQMFYDDNNYYSEFYEVQIIAEKYSDSNVFIKRIQNCSPKTGKLLSKHIYIIWI